MLPAQPLLILPAFIWPHLLPMNVRGGFPIAKEPPGKSNEIRRKAMQHASTSYQSPNKGSSHVASDFLPTQPPQKNTHVDQSHKATAKPAKPPLLTSQVTSSASRLSRLGDGCATFRARSTGTVCATPRLAHELQRLVTPSHLSRHRGRGDVRRREVNGLTCVV